MPVLQVDADAAVRPAHRRLGLSMVVGCRAGRRPAFLIRRKKTESKWH
jgi:hypothetical protein